MRRKLANVALHQDCIAEGPVDLVIPGVYGRLEAKYGPKANRYVQMEAGHAAQNIYLQAASLGLGTVVVGFFDDTKVQEVLKMEKSEAPLCIMPVGRMS